MKPLSAPQLRNVAVVGHNTVGKTTLVAAHARTPPARRRGPARSTTAPARPISTPRRSTARSRSTSPVAHAIHRDTRINFLDAPGYGIFAPEARAAVYAADAVADRPRRRLGRRGPDRAGLEVRHGVPAPGALRRQPHGPRARLVRPRRRVRCSKKFGRGVVPLQIPVGEEKALPGDRRPRPHGGAHPRGRQARGRPDPGGARRARQGRARGARRDGRRGRGRPHGEVLRAGHARGRRTSCRV